MGPLTSSPAAQLASSATVIFWSERVLLITIQVITPATAMMMPTTIAVMDANLRIGRSASRGHDDHEASQECRRSIVPDVCWRWCRSLNLTHKRSSAGGLTELTSSASARLPYRARDIRHF